MPLPLYGPRPHLTLDLSIHSHPSTACWLYPLSSPHHRHLVTDIADALDALAGDECVKVVAGVAHEDERLARAAAAVAGLAVVPDEVARDVDRVGGVVHGHMVEEGRVVAVVQVAGAVVMSVFNLSRLSRVSTRGQGVAYQSPLLYSFALGRAAETRPIKVRERTDEARILVAVGMAKLSGGKLKVRS